MANLNNRQLFLNIKATFSGCSYISNIDIQPDDIYYVFGCTFMDNNRIAFGIKKKEGVSYIKSSIKTLGMEREQIESLCNNILSGTSISYEIKGLKTVLQTIIPLQMDSFEDNFDFLFRECEAFIEAALELYNEVNKTNIVITLEKKEYKKQPKTVPTIIVPEKPKKQEEENLDKEQPDIKDIDMEIPEDKDEEFYSGQVSVSDFEKEYGEEEESENGKNVSFSGNISEEEEEHPDYEDAYHTGIEKDDDFPSINEEDMPDEDERESLSEDEKEEHPDYEAAYRAGMEKNYKDEYVPEEFEKNSEPEKTVPQQEVKNKQKMKNKGEEDREAMETNRKNYKNDALDIDIFLNYEKDMRNVDNKYQNIIRSMSIDTLLAVIENRYGNLFDKNGDVITVKESVRENICSLAKEELKKKLKS